MTRTDVMASSRPRTAGAAPIRGGSSGIRRGLLVLPVLLLMAFALATPGAAVAAGTSTTESGYNQKPNEPKEGTSPSKETTAPTTTKKSEPATTAQPEKAATKAATLPFTGLDLRWTLAAGLLLMGAGFSIVLVQRRRTDGSR
jgi:hypothetical protein